MTADNGREGLEWHREISIYSWTFMHALEMDGFEVTRRLHQEKDTYIMMMTARFNHEHCCWFPTVVLM